MKDVITRWELTLQLNAFPMITLATQLFVLLVGGDIHLRFNACRCWRTMYALVSPQRLWPSPKIPPFCVEHRKTPSDNKTVQKIEFVDGMWKLNSYCLEQRASSNRMSLFDDEIWKIPCVHSVSSVTIRQWHVFSHVAGMGWRRGHLHSD